MPPQTLPRNSGFDALDRARTLGVETPEHVRLGFELAGFGSRAAAAVADAAVFAAVVMIIVLLQALLDLGQGVLFSVGASATVFLLFLLQAGYFVFFETVWRGQTPGKRWVGCE